jgi:hypothetical protein
MPIWRFSLWAMTLPRYIVALLGDTVPYRTHIPICQARALIYKIQRVAIRLFLQKTLICGYWRAVGSAYSWYGELQTLRINSWWSGVDSLNFFPKSQFGEKNRSVMHFEVPKGLFKDSTPSILNSREVCLWNKYTLKKLSRKVTAIV